MTEQEELESVETKIEISIDQARGAVDRRDKMERLIRNPDFKEVFTVGYLEREPSRLVSLMSDADWQTEDKQKELIDDMRAISGFRQYIMGIKAMGRQMENQIARSQAELENLRTGGE